MNKTQLFHQLRCEDRDIAEMFPNIKRTPITERTRYQDKASQILSVTRMTIDFLLDGGEMELGELSELVKEVRERKMELITSTRPKANEILEYDEAPITERSPGTFILPPPSTEGDEDWPLFV